MHNLTEHAAIWLSFRSKPILKPTDPSDTAQNFRLQELQNFANQEKQVMLSVSPEVEMLLFFHIFEWKRFMTCGE